MENVLLEICFFQLCRWGYQNLTDMQNIVSRVQTAGVPLDVVYADIDYMSHYEDFTEGDVSGTTHTKHIGSIKEILLPRHSFQSWLGFGDYAKKLHSNGLHIILIFDPAVEVDYSSFQRALAQVRFTIRSCNEFNASISRQT